MLNLRSTLQITPLLKQVLRLNIDIDKESVLTMVSCVNIGANVDNKLILFFMLLQAQVLIPIHPNLYAETNGPDTAGDFNNSTTIP